MNRADRENAYFKQNGAVRLTPKQRRRAAHKEGTRAARFARQLALADELLAEMGATGHEPNDGGDYASGETWGDFGPVPMPCGTCGAVNDEPCRRPSGRKLTTPHKNRE
ncbi:MAG: hypothetical protein ACREMY_05325 [bacterium]